MHDTCMVACDCVPVLLLRRGLEAVKSSERVYLEAYTSLLLVAKEKLVPAAYEGSWGCGAAC